MHTYTHTPLLICILCTHRNNFIGHVLRLLSDYVVRMETMDPSVAKLNQTLLNYRNRQNRLEKMST